MSLKALWRVWQGKVVVGWDMLRVEVKKWMKMWEISFWGVVEELFTWIFGFRARTMNPMSTTENLIKNFQLGKMSVKVELNVWNH